MKLLTQILFTTALISFSYLYITTVQADTELENVALTRVIHVLDSLKPLLNEAERQQDKSTRIQFQYAKLREDLDQIKSGIQEKIEPKTIEPRYVAPIQGDYLILQGKHR